MPDAPRTNVLFLVADDLRPQLGCYGCSQVISPRIDQLAAQGALFERAYCQQAICAPSRSSTLSGCRPDTTGIYDIQTPLRQVMPDVLTLPQHFRNHGYQTVSIGKVYHHAHDDLQGWTRPPFRAAGNWQGRGYVTAKAIDEMKRNEPVLRQRGDMRVGVGPAFDAADVPDEGYPDGVGTQHALATLTDLADTYRKTGQPFFLATGFHKPHLPFNAPKRYWDLYDRSAIALADNPFPPEGMPKYSLVDFGELRSYFGMPAAGPIPDDLARTLINGYMACISYIDAQIGKILDALHHAGLDDNTVVILWADHGWKLGEHGSWCKHSNFETDVHGPLLIRAPGMPAGIRTPALVEYMDIYPTLCELCGLDVPRHCEGVSMLPLLNDPQRPWKPAAFHQYPRGRAMGYALRTDRYRYIEWRDRKTAEVLARELYDHSVDAAENTNLAERQDQQATLSALSAQLAAGWQAARPPASPPPRGQSGT